MNSKPTVIAVLLILAPAAAQADAVSELQAAYRAQGAHASNSAAGESLWNSSFTDAKSGQKRHCGTCHTEDLTQPGKHARTGKVIEPMAPSANPKRLTEVKKIKKWLLRNCKWTIGRECTAQEKSDLLAFLKSR